MNNHPIPKRLNIEPLIEAIWQVQFEHSGAGEIIPGILYSALKSQNPKIKLHRLPTADIPDAVARIDPNLKYAAKVRMEEPNGKYVWQVGERVITLNCRKPYSGWNDFRQAILSLTDVIEKSGVVPQPKRHTLRYIDFLTLDAVPDISALQLDMKLGQYTIRQYPLQLRLEIPDEDFTHIVQIATPAQVRLPEGPRSGTIVDLETFAVKAPLNWKNIRDQIDVLHDRSKVLFFQNLLTSEAIDKLEAEY